MMNANHDLQNLDSNKSNVQQQHKELNLMEKSNNCEMKNCFDSNTDQILKEQEEHDIKSKEYGDEVNCSFSDTDNIFNNTIKENDDKPNEKNIKLQNNNISNTLFRIIDSDSEDENIITSKFEKEESVCNKLKNKMRKKKSEKQLNNFNDTFSTVNSSDSEETVSDEVKVINNMNNRFKNLIDSESEEERNSEKLLSPIKPDKKIEKHKKGSSKSKIRKVSLKASKEETIKEIQSETQRLIRETRVSLPYHKPKQRTLQEFLNRKKVITILPKAPTMAAKLKMSSVIVDEILKEKEKEAEIFYKSSDSEEESTKIEKQDASKKHSNTECMQDLKGNNVSRKLFIDNNLPTTINNENRNNTYVMNGTNKTLIGNNTTLICSGTENNVNNLTMVETHNRNNMMMVSDEKENNANNPMVTEAHYEDNGISNETENDANSSMITEIHYESGSIENNNKILQSKTITETTENDKLDELLEKDIIESESTEKNINNENNDDKHNSDITNKNADVFTSKINNDYVKIVKQSLNITDESDDYNEYGFPPPKFDESPNINDKKSFWKMKTFKPKLSGSPGTVIDLSDNIKPCKKGINDLIDRFVHKHSKSNEPIRDMSDVTTTQIKESSNGLVIIKETLPYRLPNVVDENSELNKPGMKLVWLKKQLKHKMALKRDEEWKQKEQEMKEQEIEWNESINEEDDVDEPYSSNAESYESEENELEDDVHIKKEGKKRKKCAFIDDEAEVSEDEINDSDEIEDEDEDDEGKDEDEDVDNENKERDENKVQESSKKDKCKKVILENDSRTSTVENMEEVKDEEISFSQIKLKDMFSINTNENEFSDNKNLTSNSQVHMENDLKHQLSQTPETKNSIFDFVSPIMQLTALNTDLEGQEDSQERKKLSQQINSFPKSAMSQRKLFEDDMMKTDMDEELKTICSGRFPEDKDNFNFLKEPSVSESQLLEMCSGTFNSQVYNNKELNDLSKEMSHNTQAFDEENSLPSKKDEQLQEETPIWKKLRVLSSDDEDSVEKEINKQSKKKVKKLNLSDDEEESSSTVCSDNDSEVDDKFIDYDSEENEVVVSKKDIKQYAANFLEDEAELSGSDCEVSEDEDEHNLDNLELEDGDGEEVDETQIKNQLGKLHMRQLLNEDQKEIKMLKELLFEDGDLYTENARERKFKWKNIDKHDDNDDFQPLEDKDGWVDLSDDENEINWRKMRYEREKFLAEKMKNADIEIESGLNNSAVFKSGLKILKKRRIDEHQKEDMLVETPDANLAPKMPHIITEMISNSTLDGQSSMIHKIMKKRSFLARGEESLARLATLIRQKNAPLVKKKNFIFTPVDMTAKNKNSL